MPTYRLRNEEENPFVEYQPEVADLAKTAVSSEMEKLKDSASEYEEIMKQPIEEDPARVALRNQQMSLKEKLPFLIRDITRKEGVGDSMQKEQERRRTESVSGYDEARKQKIADYLQKKNLQKGDLETQKTQFELAGMEQSQKDAAEEKDPTSKKSVMAQNVVKQFSPRFASMVEGKSSEEIKMALPWMKDLIDHAQQKELTQMQVDADVAKAAIASEGKSNENKLFIPQLGVSAPNEKAYAEATEAIATANSLLPKIQQMIDLRTKHGGGKMGFLQGAKTNDDIASGKALAEDVRGGLRKLGSVKGMSEAAIEAMQKRVPDDPLEIDFGAGDEIFSTLNTLYSSVGTELNATLRAYGLPQMDFSQKGRGEGNSDTKEINGVKYIKVNGGWQKAS
jgi:hypothetical protein